MILPRYSIRTMLAVFVGVAIAAVFAGQALVGRTWAVGVTVAVLSVPAALGMQALFFAICSGMARILGAQETVARTSRGGVERTRGSEMADQQDGTDSQPATAAAP
jgi:hypothetical protein